MMNAQQYPLFLISTIKIPGTSFNMDNILPVLSTINIDYYFKYCLPCSRHKTKNQVTFLPIDAFVVLSIFKKPTFERPAL